MISIFQENQHVVCCVGSSLQASNQALFSTADVAIGFSPMPSHCLNLAGAHSTHSKSQVRAGSTADASAARIDASVSEDLSSDISMTDVRQSTSSRPDSQQVQFDAYSGATQPTHHQPPPERKPYHEQFDLVREKPLSSINFLKQPTTNSFGCDMTSLACAFVMDKNGNFETFLKLIQEARGLLVTSTQALKFYLMAHLLVHCTILICYCAILPMILAGVHIIWLCVVTIPILTISLLFSKKEPTLMKEISDRSPMTRDSIKRHIRLYCLQIIPTAIMCVAIFAWYVKCETHIHARTPHAHTHILARSACPYFSEYTLF
jgi:magnesium-transporting ATPase (P-type)